MNYASLPPTFRDMTSRTDWLDVIAQFMEAGMAILTILVIAGIVAIAYPRIRKRIPKFPARPKPIKRFFFAIGFSRETPGNQS